VERHLAAVRAARTDPAWVVLEGAHALKHALRFGADVDVVLSPDLGALGSLLAALAPDIAPRAAKLTVGIPAHRWEHFAPRPLPSPALALARRPPAPTPAAVLASSGVVVVLEQPRHLGNLGAVIRVAAAAGAGGVLVVGEADPWHPVVVRGAAGLQYALPVGRTEQLPATTRPLVALDAGGTPLTEVTLPTDAVLLVGTERGGLSPTLQARATASLAIPMRPGVSSLNLATAVAVALYHGR